MVQEINDVCKETLAVLAYVDDDLLDKIPSKVLKKLIELAADSNADFYINSKKDLDEQNISEECKDLIALIYYDYVANEDEKKELLRLWDENENEYQKELREKYNPDNIFQNKSKEIPRAENVISSNTAMIEYKKQTIFDKIRNFIKNIFKKTK